MIAAHGGRDARKAASAENDGDYRLAHTRGGTWSGFLGCRAECSLHDLMRAVGSVWDVSFLRENNFGRPAPSALLRYNAEVQN